MRGTMIRKTLFWLHLSTGVAAGVFIFIMAATGVLLSFERQMVEIADRDIRFISVPENAQAQPLNDLLASVRRADFGEPTAIVLTNQPQAALQFSIGRDKNVYVDPYSGAVLGNSSQGLRQFFFAVERLHRTLGSPMGSKGLGHALAAASNLLFGLLIVLGVFLWIPRRWNRKTLRASGLFRSGLRGRAREWNWHNVIGIWCAAPLFIIALTGVVMSYDWANTLLFKLSGSPVPVRGARPGERRRPQDRPLRNASEPNYESLVAALKTLNPEWRTITLNVAAAGPVSSTVDTGTGGQPQKRVQYLLNRDTADVLKTTAFADGSLGQRLRAFVRFGHTGEWGGLAGQSVAAIASLGGCFLVYTGFALAIRRLIGNNKARRRPVETTRNAYTEQPVA